MARSARSKTVFPNICQIVHVWNRCIRAWALCGIDPESGADHEYRRQWSVDRLKHLASIFAIDVITYTIMSNHFHQVLRSRPDIAEKWSPSEVVRRWLKISPRSFNRDGTPKEPTEKQIKAIAADKDTVEVLRRRLSDISWWMKYYSQWISAKANKEDEKTGHFWEGRFKSDVLMEDLSLLRCMLYVDLNPVRASIARSPEDSMYTGAKDRIDDLRFFAEAGNDGNLLLSVTGEKIPDRWDRLDTPASGWLSPIEINESMDSIGDDEDGGLRRASKKGCLNMSAIAYLKLLDAVGRQVRPDKPGAIDSSLEPILARLNIDQDKFVGSVLSYGSKHRLKRKPKLAAKDFANSQKSEMNVG